MGLNAWPCLNTSQETNTQLLNIFLQHSVGKVLHYYYSYIIKDLLAGDVWHKKYLRRSAGENVGYISVLSPPIQAS